MPSSLLLSVRLRALSNNQNSRQQACQFIVPSLRSLVYPSPQNRMLCPSEPLMLCSNALTLITSPTTLLIGHTPPIHWSRETRGLIQSEGCNQQMLYSPVQAVLPQCIDSIYAYKYTHICTYKGTHLFTHMRVCIRNIVCVSIYI